jgi:hypothetical protein
MHDLPFWMAGATNFSNQKFYYGASLASSSLFSPCNGGACRKQSFDLTLMIFFFFFSFDSCTQELQGVGFNFIFI